MMGVRTEIRTPISIPLEPDGRGFRDLPSAAHESLTAPPREDLADFPLGLSD